MYIKETPRIRTSLTERASTEILAIQKYLAYESLNHTINYIISSKFQELHQPALEESQDA